uniref:Small ribosomal subunit protein uS8c n=1 Tax=Populus trichocarpa TaxID=3694 RepID=A0A2K2CBN2_POPTR
MNCARFGGNDGVSSYLESSLNLKCISRPGLRIYSNYQQIPRILDGMGIVILSTSRGIMTD